MNIERIEKCFEKYGGELTVKENGKEKKVKAFVQPLRYKNKIYLGDTYIPAGCFDGGHYLYVGSITARIDRDYRHTTIIYDGEEYVCKRADAYYVGDVPLYVWAVIYRSSTLAGRV